ncbi:MAG: 30S ribosomal protein S17 [bacterium]|nr:30S ribosomal protein S17 [bacterium]
MTKNEKTTKRRIEGVIVSDKMAKTRVVSVERMKKHAKYLKYYKTTTRFKAHDEENQYKVGDNVVIEEARPLSKDKRWKIIGTLSATNIKRNTANTQHN